MLRGQGGLASEASMNMRHGRTQQWEQVSKSSLSRNQPFLARAFAVEHPYHCLRPTTFALDNFVPFLMGGSNTAQLEPDPLSACDDSRWMWNDHLRERDSPRGGPPGLPFNPSIHSLFQEARLVLGSLIESLVSP